MHAPITVALLGSLALAQGVGQDLLRRMDSDGDGAISREEWRGPAEGFARLDRDGDGRIAGTELRGATSPRPDSQGPDPRRFDRDGDGRLSLQEAAAFVFARMDADGDGIVTREEADALPVPGPFAERGGGGRKRLFRELDHDRDGKLAAAEFALPDALWRTLDRDQDGFVSFEELRPRDAGPGARRGLAGLDVRNAEELLARMDGNGDGEIARAEWRGAEALFERFDGDKDGKLTRTEVEVAIERAKRAGVIREPEGFVERFDKNGDGRVTREEFAGPDEAFSRADRNGDGVVTAADRPAGSPAEPERSDGRRRRGGV